MLHTCYLKKDNVYLPTMVSQGIARYMDVDPVTVVPVADTEGLRRAIAGYNSQRKPISRSEPSRTPASRQLY